MTFDLSEDQGSSNLTLVGTLNDGQSVTVLVKGGMFIHVLNSSETDVGLPTHLSGHNRRPDVALAEAIPGFADARAECPCSCYSLAPTKSTLANCIVHLNDSHEWTRERIADWLDTLDLDLSFQTDKKEKE